MAGILRHGLSRGRPPPSGQRGSLSQAPRAGGPCRQRVRAAEAAQPPGRRLYARLPRAPSARELQRGHALLAKIDGIGPLPLQPVSATRFRSADGALQLDFQAHANGNVTGVVLTARGLPGAR